MKRKVGIIFLAFIMIVFLSITQVIAGPKPPTPDPAIMEKLDQILKKLEQLPPTWGQILPSSERFVLVMNDQAVLDKETGLVWGRNVPTTHPEVPDWTFYNAFNWCQSAIIGGRYGWRVPVVEEIMTLIDPSLSTPDRLPAGHPFIIDMEQAPLIFWTTTTLANDTVIKYGRAVGIGEWLGNYNLPKSDHLKVWCVRGGHGYDGDPGY